MTYNPAGNNGQGSLLILRFEPSRLVGEISIPTLSSVEHEPVADRCLWSTTSSTRSKGHALDVYPEGGTSIALGGLLIHNGKLW
jgi:hypothetical protein